MANNHNTPRLRLLTPEQAAKDLQVCTKTVLRWGRQGKLKSFRLGWRTVRFDPEDVSRMVRETAV